MNFRKIKKITFALTLALGFTGAPGLSSLSTVQAQKPQDPQTQEKPPKRLEKRVIMEEQGAFRDGYRDGSEDFRARRSFDYKKHHHYQMGGREYREMFRKGYTRGYRQHGQQ
jgi:hypothetical protein